MKHLLILLISLLLTCLSCGDGDQQGKKRKVIGPVNSAPYELLVVCNKSWYKSDAGAHFRQFVNTFMPGMPQNEPIFKVICINEGSFTKTFIGFGGIIFVNVGPKYKEAQFITARNMYARPQMVVTLNAPTFAGIDSLVDRHGDHILDLMADNEIKRSTTVLKRNHSGVVKQYAEKLFGCEWLMPQEITQVKPGKDFFWASSLDNTYNACMYAYPWVSDSTFTKDFFVAKRDSFMRGNIQGEEWGQHMETDASTVTVRERMLNGHYVFEAHGLWDMKGDAMGGPFVSHVQLDSMNNRIIVTEGFVYLPNKEKKKMMHAIEAGLRTLKMNP